ncbi:ABC transporter permease [Dactylosporangium sp. CA-233914]|uniref:ABC transporter permease n=1 Tax=Dactylosporangium sp. CA-233914 TaxID=3239934 RepID=UPI003D8A8CB8
MEAVVDTSSAVAPGSDAPGVDRKERIVRTIFLFAIPFIMISMMFATYMSTMHSPHPRGMPVAVIGSDAQAQAVGEQLHAASGDATEVRAVASRGEAVDLLKNRKIVAALQPPAAGGDAATILTAMAAGASQATTAQQLLAPVAIQQQWTTTVDDIAPLPDGDRAGIAVLFAAMGMMLAGYVPLSMLLGGLPHLLRLRRFLPLLAGWSAATSTIIWLILGPIVGAVDGHYLTFLGIGMLATAAVGLTQLLFTKVMGPFAVLLGMLLYVVFGMPSSNLAVPVYSMPGFFQFLHGILPLPAAGEALRSALYFEHRSIAPHLITLAVWIIAALVLCLLKERSASGTTIPGAPPVTDPDAKLPAFAGGPLRSKRFRYIAVPAFPLTILTVVVGVMSFSMHDPQPHKIPVAILAANPAQADQAADGLRQRLDGILDIQVATSVPEATERIRDRDIVAAFALPTERGGTATLYSSSAAGYSQQTMVRSIFQQISAAQQMPLATNDLTPLHTTDTMGSNSLYVGMSWIMSGFLIMAVLRGGAPHLRRLRQFVPYLGGWAIGMSVWLWLLFDVIIDAVSGPPLAMIGFGVLTILAVALATGVFTRTLGLPAIIPVMAVMVMAGVPASGGGLSIYMVPELFQPLRHLLPLPAAVDTARSLTYFGGTATGHNLLIIAVWAGAGLLLNLAIDRWLRRRERRTDASHPSIALETSAARVDTGQVEPANAY